jgi:hypothetical protein
MHGIVKQCVSTMSPMGIVDEEKKSLWLLSICGLSVCRK